MQYVEAWWHRVVLGHYQEDFMNDGQGGPRTECWCDAFRTPEPLRTWYW